MAKPFLNSQNMAILLPHLAEDIQRETLLPAINIKRLEKMVDELKSCADTVLELSKKERAQEGAMFNDERSSKD